MRTVGAVGNETLRLIRSNAVHLIAEHGFEAFNLRQLAARVGLAAGSLYNYIGSKQDLLFELLRDVMEDLLAAVEAEVLVRSGTMARFQAFVQLHIQYHVDRKNDVLIASTELRSLASGNRRRIVELRDRYERALTLIIRKGCSERLFVVDDARLVTLALIPMLTGVCQWYQPGGRLSREQLIQSYITLCLRVVGARRPNTNVVTIEPWREPGQRTRFTEFPAKRRRVTAPRRP
jgi:AcrR family transcriptional regulator